MKKKTKKIIAACCAVILIAAVVCGAMVYNLFYGPIKTKTPISIKTSSAVKDTSEIYMIGHRGLSAIAPENTLAAFEKAGEEGFFGCEFDIQLTSDGEWVVMHDPELKKMTGKFGKIVEMTAADVTAREITNGANIASYPGLHVPTFDETLKVLSEYDIVPVIEIKTASTEKIAEMLETIGKYGFEEKAWIISFEKAPLEKTRELDKDIKMSFLTHEVTQEAVDFCIENDLNGLDFDKKNATAESVEMIVKAGLVPQVWTVDTIEDFETFYSYGVRYFTGNCLTY